MLGLLLWGIGASMALAEENEKAKTKSIEDQLAKAKELLEKMYYQYFDPCVTEQDLENRDKLFEEVKQFLKEIE